jgi:hypothetical protein
MDLYFIGVNHFNPKHRSKLIETYNIIFNIYDSQPSFLALEYNESHANQFICQRKHFEQLCREEWPYLSKNVLTILTESLAFETDKHTDIFPFVKILWLDNDRNVPENNILKYAEGRLTIYKQYIMNTNALITDDSILNILDEYSMRNTPGFEISERDNAFAKIVINILSSYSNGNYGIIVVGSHHASDNNCSMRNLIEKTNTKCTVFIL